MIFSCSKCNARYKLPDEKVANRVLKVRCKNCGVVIVVRDPAARRAASQKPGRAGAGASEGPWYVAVDGQQRGPMESEGVRALVRAGVVDASSYAWRPGLKDWAPLGRLPEAALWLREAAGARAAEAGRTDGDIAERPAPGPSRPGDTPSGESSEDSTVADSSLAGLYARYQEEERARKEVGRAAEAAPDEDSGGMESPPQPGASEEQTSLREEAGEEQSASAASGLTPAEDSGGMESAPGSEEPAASAEDSGGMESPPQPGASEEHTSLREEAGEEQSASAASGLTPAEDSGGMESAPGSEEPAQTPSGGGPSGAPGGGITPHVGAEEQAHPTKTEGLAPEPEEEEILDDVQVVEEPASPAAPEVPEESAPSGMPALPPDAEELAPKPGHGEEAGVGEAPAPPVEPSERGAAQASESPADERADEGPGGVVDDADARASLDEDLALFDEYEADGDAFLGLAPDDLHDAESEPARPAGPTKEERDLLKKAMKDAATVDVMNVVERPSRAERKTLRQEFSVVAELDRSKRRRSVGFVVLAAVLVGVAVLAVVMVQTQRMERRTRNAQEFKSEGSAVPVADYKAVYDSLVEEREAELDRPLTRAERDELAQRAAQEAAERDESPHVQQEPKKASPRPKRPQRVARRDEEAQREAKAEANYRKLTDDEFAKLTAESGGKAEVKVGFDPTAAAREAEEAAEEKRARVAGERAQEVARTFAKKRRQLARCKDDLEEKLKAEFTVAPSGRVTSVDVTGTRSSSKAKCVADILERAMFPAGPQSQTYRQSLTL
ncbi:MAG: GYF domain-containing protein [Myxococcota bacterium]